MSGYNGARERLLLVGRKLCLSARPLILTGMLKMQAGSERGIASTIHGAGPAGRAKARPNSLPANLSNRRVRTKTSLSGLNEKGPRFCVGLFHLNWRRERDFSPDSIRFITH